MATPSLSSADVLHKLEEQLTCSICFEQYNNPKILPCFHSFCVKCLERVPLELQQGNYTLPCPTCRSPCQLPQQRVQALPSSFTINNLTEVCNSLKKIGSGDRNVSCDNCSSPDADRYCKQCTKFLCQQCISQHDKWITDHQTLGLDEVVNTVYQPPQEATSNCADHGNPLEIFCETCEELICQTCAVQKHKDHNHDFVKYAFAKHKLIIESSLQLLNQKIHQLAEALANLVRRREETEDQGGKVKHQIHLEFAQIKELLDQRERQLVKEVDAALQYKIEVTDCQTKEAEEMLQQLIQCNDHIQQCLKVGTPHQILTTKTQMTNHTENLISIAKKETFEPLEQADIEFVKPYDSCILHDIVSFGKVTYATYTRPSLPTSVTSSYQHVPQVGQQSTISVCLSLQDGRPAPVPSSLIKLQLSPPDGKESIQCSIKESSQSAGQYNVVFTPNTRGVHQLHVTIHNKALPGSPMSIPVSVLPKIMNTPVKTIGIGLQVPTGIAVTDDGQVIVCERTGHCITLIDSTKGKKVRSFGSRLYLPEDIAITSKGTLLVSDHGNNRIQEFTMDGKCISCVGSDSIFTSGPLNFNGPRGIAINKITGQVYVTDCKNNRVQVLNSDLTFSHMFGSRGFGKGYFNFPFGVAFDSEGLVYVADTNNHRIQQFTPEGKHLSSFGTKGSAPGQLTFPRDITVDDNDLLYICEGTPNRRVSIFTIFGEFVHCFGHGNIGSPYRSVFDKRGYLYVCDSRDPCNIKIF